MIFVTVGTHEQQFNRLVEYMDQWAANHDEPVIIQTGYSRYEPKHCQWKRLYPHEEITELIKEARIVISHGGPSSFVMVLKEKKIPIVVPRQLAYNEHINDHQLDFCRELARRWENIILVEDVDALSNVIERYDDLTKDMRNDYTSNTENFVTRIEDMIEEL